MYPHRIRLRGPWEVIAAGHERRSVKFPATWADVGLPDFRGLVTFERRFGFPGRLDAEEHVWLVGQYIVGPADISLQNEPLIVGVSGQLAIEITPRLRDRNLLTISLEIGDTAPKSPFAPRKSVPSDKGPRPSDLWDDIALEIRAAAYFAEISHVGQSLQGLVGGTCSGPLEVYAIAESGTIGYGEVLAGRPFQIALDRDGPITRVELIHVSTVWDVFELSPGDASES
jgi:hypothetical protein